MGLGRWLPGLATLKSYQVSFLPHDLAAGVTLGAVLVPVGLAYGELAGLPLAGLYGSMLPLLAYFLFGSSRQVVVGVLCLLAGLLRLGFVANFLSKPVIVGFMHGVALVIIVSQLPKVLGIRAAGETTLEQFASLLPRLGDTNLVTLAIGAGSFALILLCRRFVPRVPGAVVALMGALLAVVLFGLDRYGIAVVGRIPTGLPQLSLPMPTLADFDDLLAVALAAALLAFSDTMVTARAFAARNRYRIDANQELLGIGMANLVSGVSQGLPISASDSRTAVVEAAGGRTQVTSVIAALVVAAVMLWFTQLLYWLPSAALGGILIASAWGLCDFGEFARLLRFRGISLAGALVTLVGVVVLGLMEGILLGVVFSLVLLLRALAFPPDAVLGRTSAGEWHDPVHRPEAAPGSRPAGLSLLRAALLRQRRAVPRAHRGPGRRRRRARDGRGGGRRCHPRRRHHGLRHAGRARQRARELRRPARLRQSARPSPARHRARPAAAAGRRGGVFRERRRRRCGRCYQEGGGDRDFNDLIVQLSGALPSESWTAWSAAAMHQA